MKDLAVEGGGLRTQASPRGPRLRIVTAVTDSEGGAPGRIEDVDDVRPRRGIPALGGIRRPPGRGLAGKAGDFLIQEGIPDATLRRRAAGASGAGTSRGSGEAPTHNAVT